MRLADDVITIFNKWLDDDGYDVWEPTSLRGVSWYSTVESAVSDKGLLAANKYTIRIPEGVTVLAGKTFVDPVTYQDGDRSSSWTLQHGDLIVHGTETSNAMTPKQLQEKYGEVVTVLGVTDNRRAPKEPHWRVIGK